MLNVISGLRYTRISAEILFDMRLALYRHFQRLSPRFYARTRWAIVSRLITIRRNSGVAPERAGVDGQCPFLIGTIGSCSLAGRALFLVDWRLLPVSVWAPVRYRRALERRCRDAQASAAIGSFLVRHCRDEAGGDFERAGARRGRFEAEERRVHSGTDVDAALTYLAGALPGLILSCEHGFVFLYGGLAVIDGTLPSAACSSLFMAYQMRLCRRSALMGLYASLATAQVSLGACTSSSNRPEVRSRPRTRPPSSARRRHAFENVTLPFVAMGTFWMGVSFEGPGETVAVSDRAAVGNPRSPICCCGCSIPMPAWSAGRPRPARFRSEDLRRHVVLVDQEPFVFHATIAENIRYVRGWVGCGLGDAAARQARAILSRPAATIRNQCGRARDGFVGCEAAAGDRAGVSGRSSGVDFGRADCGARSGVGATGYHRVRGANAGANHHSDLASVRGGKPRGPCDCAAGWAERKSPARSHDASSAQLLRRERVAVVDSGIYAAHPHVNGIAGGVAIVSDDYVNRLGHGTAVTAVIREKAPDAEIFAVKIFDRKLATDAQTLARAIEWCAANGIEWINLSLGTAKAEHAELLQEAVDDALSRGARVVSAYAGSLPGCLPGRIPVLLIGTALARSAACENCRAAARPIPHPAIHGRFRECRRNAI